MPAFILAIMPWIVTFFITRALFMFAAVGISASLIVYLYNMSREQLLLMAGDSIAGVAFEILALAGVGEFIGIMFGAAVTATLFRSVVPFTG